MSVAKPNLRVALLPCDTRPPTLELPLQHGAIAGLDVVAPPLSMLNQLNVPGDTEKMAAWLWEQRQDLDALVVCLETLCLGGMIPARRVDTPLATALSRLALLSRLKEANPNLRIFAFGVIVRVAHDNDPLEEKPYYGEHGAALRRVSELTDRAERDAAQAPDLAAARLAVPPEVLSDWLETRERNHALHQEALRLLGAGVLEHLCLTLDDTTPYGLAARDRRRLERALDEAGLWDKADVYPGADEVASTLLARMLRNTQVAKNQGVSPKVFVRYPSTQAENAVMLYEDRRLGELVKAHVRAAGFALTNRLEEAAFVLAVNAPSERQAHRQPNWETVDTANRNLPAFVDDIREDMDLGRVVSVADVAYANGAENRLVGLLLRQTRIVDLAGFAAWNTAGNTLGSAVASGACAFFGRASGQHRVPGFGLAEREALLSRLVDDWLYQSKVRPEVREALGNPSPFDLGDAKARAELEIETRIAPQVQELWRTHFAPHLPGVVLEREAARLAWPRLFTGVFVLRLLKDNNV